MSDNQTTAPPLDIHALAAQLAQSAMRDYFAAIRINASPASIELASYEMSATRQDMEAVNNVVYSLEAGKPRRYVAQPGEISRAIRETLRDAGKPLTVRDLTMGVMALRGMDPSDAAQLAPMQKRVTASLRNLHLGGSVRSHKEPGSHLRWGLSDGGG